MEATLGRKLFGEGSPEVSLVATGEWCSGTRVDKDRGKCKIITVTEFLQKYGHLTASSSLLPEDKLGTVVEHFDVVSFSKKSNLSDNVEKQFGFLVDNKTEKQENQYAVASVYSLQDDEKVFNNFAVPPGKESRLVRYEKDDRAFCLTENPSILEEETTVSKKTAQEIFEAVRENKKNVCAFSIMLVRAKARPPRPLRGLLVETDGRSFDGPSLTNKQQHYTNLVEGSKTNQRFTRVSLEYEDAPIHIYNVVLFME